MAKCAALLLVKNQWYYITCWAFAFVGHVEVEAVVITPAIRASLPPWSSTPHGRQSTALCQHLQFTHRPRPWSMTSHWRQSSTTMDAALAHVIGTSRWACSSHCTRAFRGHRASASDMRCARVLDGVRRTNASGARLYCASGGDSRSGVFPVRIVSMATATTSRCLAENLRSLAPLQR